MRSYSALITQLLYCTLLLVLNSCKQQATPSQTVAMDWCSGIHQTDSSTLGTALAGLDSLQKSSTGTYVLEDGDGSMIARAWLSEHAEHTIDIQYFIFALDNVGLIACDYLVRAADRGVKVRILVDDIMVEAVAEDILTLAAHPNIDLKIYNPGTNLGKNILQKAKKVVTDFRGINQRMHNKTFIVDQKVVITGGRNIADEYFDYDHAYNFRDRDVLLIGKTCKDVQQSFNTFWDSALSLPVETLFPDQKQSLSAVQSFEKLHQYSCNPANFWPQVRQRIAQLPEAFRNIQQSGDLVWVDQVEFVSDDPGKNTTKTGLGGGGKTTSALMQLVQEATTSIDIQSPYLITTELSRNLFEAAISRGVKVRILTNSLASTDNLQAFAGYQRDRQKLLKTGVEIYEFRPDAKVRFDIMTGSLQKEMNYTPIFGLHAKTMVIDGITTVVGTFNLDPRSANLNTECLAIIKDQKIATKVLKGMNVEFQPENAWRTTTSFNPDSEVGRKKRVKTFLNKVVPKGIL